MSGETGDDPMSTSSSSLSSAPPAHTIAIPQVLRDLPLWQGDPVIGPMLESGIVTPIADHVDDALSRLLYRTKFHESHAVKRGRKIFSHALSLEGALRHAPCLQFPTLWMNTMSGQMKSFSMQMDSVSRQLKKHTELLQTIIASQNQTAEFRARAYNAHETAHDDLQPIPCSMLDGTLSPLDPETGEAMPPLTSGAQIMGLTQQASILWRQHYGLSFEGLTHENRVSALYQFCTAVKRPR